MTTEDGKLRVLQVGCGPRARSHLQAMNACGAVRIVGLCDLDEKRLADAGEAFGVAARFRDMAEAIHQTEPQLVDIVTPPTLRVGIVRDAIEAGAPHILIEKPIALKPSEVRALVAMGRERLIAVNTQYQWMPHWQRFWKLLETQAIGQVWRICCGTRTNILEQGPHALDLALKAARLSGLGDPQWVLAACSGIERFGSMPVPADTAATVGLGEARIHLNQGASSPPVPGEKIGAFHNTVDILASEGRLWVSLNQGWKLWRGHQFESGETGWPRTDQQAQPAMFRDLRDAVHNGSWRAFPTRVEVAAQIADLMFACYASALQRRVVSLPTELDDAIVDQLEQLAGDGGGRRA